jgi:uncharacterized protein (TIGR02145 family)
MLAFLPFFISCKKIEREPKIVTGAVSDITTTSAKAEGNIIDLGEGITDHGHCWSVTLNPTTSDFKTLLGPITNTGHFTSELQNLQTGTKYYSRAYVKHGDETIYSRSEVSFKTSTVIETDIDGNVYYGIQIGTQLWMRENLKTTKYNDGTNISLVADNTAWSDLTTPGYCWYGNDAATYKNVYGALYNWYAVGTSTLCPTGWHVPSDADWTILTTYLGGENAAGGKLKETSYVHWQTPNAGATNESGFAALPGGYREYSGSFASIGYNGLWWSSTEYNTTNAWYRSLGSEFNMVVRQNDRSMKTGFSVRCIKD